MRRKKYIKALVLVLPRVLRQNCSRRSLRRRQVSDSCLSLNLFHHKENYQLKSICQKLTSIVFSLLFFHPRNPDIHPQRVPPPSILVFTSRTLSMFGVDFIDYYLLTEHLISQNRSAIPPQRLVFIPLFSSSTTELT